MPSKKLQESVVSVEKTELIPFEIDLNPCIISKPIRRIKVAHLSCESNGISHAPIGSKVWKLRPKNSPLI